jgi:hypothetical protein
MCSERSEEVGEEGALSWHCGSHESGFFLSHIKERSVEEGRVGGSSLDEARIAGWIEGGSGVDASDLRCRWTERLESEALCRPQRLVHAQSRAGGFFPAREASRRCFTRFI